MFDEGETIRDGIAHHPRGTTGWFRERGQHPHHGRFAGTVRAKHTVDDTFRNGQREVVDGEDSSVLFRQVVSFDCKPL